MDDAEFLLAHGAECLGRPGNAEPREASLDEIRAVLEAGAEKGLPLLIANPDIVTVSGADLIVMPGTFGRWYKEMGGQVCAPRHCKGQGCRVVSLEMGGQVCAPRRCKGAKAFISGQCARLQVAQGGRCCESGKAHSCQAGSISLSCCFNAACLAA